MNVGMFQPRGGKWLSLFGWTLEGGEAQEMQVACRQPDIRRKVLVAVREIT